VAKNNGIKIGVIGAGAMGSGIAQLAASHGHEVVINDLYPAQLQRAKGLLEKNLRSQVEKGRMDELQARAVLTRIDFADSLLSFTGCDLVIEAAVEDLKVKQEVFKQLEDVVGGSTILATNTSSLSIASIASICKKKVSRVIGIHFFNPPTVLPLVEIIPALTTAPDVVLVAREIISGWGKLTVLARDTPGFIVNRIARPFYGEALRIAEEGIADIATIDWAMKEIGGFKMGPFELMDFIGNDVNYRVSESIFEALYFDPRYRPSLTQMRLFEAGLFGRKTGRGHYDYQPGAVNPDPNRDDLLGRAIFERILAMLINEAAEALLFKIATVSDIELAMTKGVNYPKGLFKWADEMGPKKVLSILEGLQAEYGEDRYRPSSLLRRKVREGKNFHE